MSSFKVIPFSSKIVSLVTLPSGGLAFLPFNEGLKIFSIVSFRGFESFHWNKNNRSVLTFVAIARQYRKVSNFELFPGKGIQYARSAGSFGKITNKDLSNHTAVIHLPSGVRKIISILSVILPNRAAGIDKRLIKNTKSGFWRSFGFKSKVRGVAMNPIDHPHGGRTKALRYPRTPWGKTTKFK